MQACTFFDHRDCPTCLYESIKKILMELIEKKGVKVFYVGTQGRFDQMVRSVLEELESEYWDLTYFVVLAYLPNPSDEVIRNSVYPEGLEKVPRRYAISWRNRWMLSKADYVVTYVEHSWGGAASFADLARRKGKKSIICKKQPLPDRNNLREGAA